MIHGNSDTKVGTIVTTLALFLITFLSMGYGVNHFLIKTTDEVEEDPTNRIIRVNVNDESDGIDIILTHLKGEALKMFKKLSLEEQMKEARMVEEKLREAREKGEDYFIHIGTCNRCVITQIGF